jgi:isopenicillin N synthase-like dioxygenase
MADDPIPVVDTASWVPSLELSTCRDEDLADALRQCSCMLVTGHGVPAGLRRRISAVSAAFFDLSDDEKERVRWPGSGSWQGWLPVFKGAAGMSDNGSPDLVEWFSVSDIDGFSQWPSRPLAMRETWTAYYRACRSVTSDLVLRLARGLALPSEELSRWTSRPFCNLGVNNYPSQLVPPRPGQLRSSPHTDDDGITILTADDAPGGLEVRMPGSRVWTPVVVPDGTFFVQAGDLFARWTNRLVSANVHRVVNPPLESAATARRQTIVFFHYPDLDTVVTPASSCVQASGAPPLAPLHAGQHRSRNQVAFAAAEGYRRLDEQVV